LDIVPEVNLLEKENGPMKILIVDDDLPTVLYLQDILNRIPDLSILAVASSEAEAVRLAEVCQPLVIFVDLDMPGMNSLEVAGTIAQLLSDVYFIFLTACTDYALQAFELYPFDYILKPFNEERIKRSITKLKQRIHIQPATEVKAGTVVSINTQERRVFLNSDEISYVEARWPKICIKTQTAEYCISGSLSDLEEKLSPHGFFRSHRSYLVNPKQVKEIIKSGSTY
jgi:DNA-binding LytR/AlgR family response regulator